MELTYRRLSKVKGIDVSINRKPKYQGAVLVSFRKSKSIIAPCNPLGVVDGRGLVPLSPAVLSDLGIEKVI